MKRFFDKVNKKSKDDCWDWLASKRGKTGYGAFKFNGKTIDSHRMSWIIHNGEIPKNICVCHMCDNRLCVNPNHLFLGSHSENMKDAIAKGKLTLPKGEKFKIGRIPNNAAISMDMARQIKLLIKSRKCTLKELSQKINISYQLIRDISCNRVYK